MVSNAKITIVVPTLASYDRASSLKKAINSCRASVSIVDIIVVVNGNSSDNSVCEWLVKQPDVRVEFVSKPSAPNAIFVGRKYVETPFFGFLDDDDELLPGGIDKRLNCFFDSPNIDIVISNGYIDDGYLVRIFSERLDEVSTSPLRSLMDGNWLSSCGGMFRSKSFPVDFFYDYHPYAEWTWLAFKLSLANKCISILDEPTFRINNTPSSLSKSSAYREAYFTLFKRMLERNPSREIKKIIKKKLGAAHHDHSDRDLYSGRYFSALAEHFKSLCLPGGISYLPYTRKFLVPRMKR